MSIRNIDQSRPTCRQCRARKVRCDRVGTSCSPCTRLHLECSLGGGLSHLESSISRNNDDCVVPRRLKDITEAGLKRRRTKHACRQCRLLKVKCSGDDPCARCSRQGQQCDPMLNESPRSVPASSASPTPVRTWCDFSTLEKRDVRTYIEAYFDKTSPSICVFLHKPSFLAEWSRGNIDQSLLIAVCASGLRLCTDTHDHKLTSRTWIKYVQTNVLSKMNCHSMAHLQILVLIVQFHMATGQHSEAWTLISLAARLAFTLRLNYENVTLELTARETRRRIVWAIYQLDRKLAGGNDDLAVCPSSKIHISLPCDYHSFLRGISSRAERLENAGHREDECMDVLGYCILLGSIHYKILR
jgi:hypothetical protein